MANQVDKLVFGIAGNSPGYLEQTGEINAFSSERVALNGPKALFPIYVEGHNSFLGTQPFSNDSLNLPKEADATVQLEPELAIKYRVSYRDDGSVDHLQPYALTVINDVTYRNRQVIKLAEKKNWGESSKGISHDELLIESLQPGIEIEQLRLCGFYKRKGQWFQCSQDVSVTQYIVFYQELTEWILNSIYNQKDEGAMHCILDLFHSAGQPDSITVAIGAPSYTESGANHSLLVGDEVAVCLYHESEHHLDKLPRLFDQSEILDKPNLDMILLKQVVGSQKDFSNL